MLFHVKPSLFPNKLVVFTVLIFLCDYKHLSVVEWLVHPLKCW